MNLLLQQTERHGETVNGGGRCWRAAGDPNINGDNGVAAAPDAVEIVENTAADTARAVGNTDFMIGGRLIRPKCRHTHRPGDCASK
ncbi:Uncharacterised protein [Shigella flexneri]|nr:Uncharacterised protein [Shigella flexneri]